MTELLDFGETVRSEAASGGKDGRVDATDEDGLSELFAKAWDRPTERKKLEELVAKIAG